MKKILLLTLLSLAFNTRTESHEQSHNGMVSKYKLVKTVLEYR